MILVAYIFLDMKLVERYSKNCEALIHKATELKTKTGSYPSAIDNNADHSLERCTYVADGDTYNIVLSGGMLNMQAYVYSSEEDKWYWD